MTETTGTAPRYEFLRYEQEGHIAWITLHRPDVLNAMHPPLSAELADAWERLRDDPDVWVGILTGAGDRAFSAGADLKWRAAQGDALRSRPPAAGPGVATAAAGGADATAASTAASRRRGFSRGRDLHKPLIAAVNGYAVGGGLELAMACDIIVAAEHARFGLPEPRRGLMADAGGVHRLVRRIPHVHAMGLILTGRLIEAPEALRLGLINEVVPAAELRAAAQRWADQIMECSPLAIQASKQAALEGLDLPLAEAMGRVFPAQQRLRESADFVEGPRAFAEKRKPRWTGR